MKTKFHRPPPPKHRPSLPPSAAGETAKDNYLKEFTSQSTRQLEKKVSIENEWTEPDGTFREDAKPPSDTDRVCRTITETDIGGFMNTCFIGERRHSYQVRGWNDVIHRHTTYFVDVLVGNEAAAKFAGTLVTRCGQRFLRKSFRSDGDPEFLFRSDPLNLPGHPARDEITDEPRESPDDYVGRYDARYRTEVLNGVYGAFYAACLPLFKRYLETQPQSLTTDPAYWVMRMFCEMHCTGEGYVTLTRPPFDGLLSMVRTKFQHYYLGPLLLNPAEGDLEPPAEGGFDDEEEDYRDW